MGLKDQHSNVQFDLIDMMDFNDKHYLII